MAARIIVLACLEEEMFGPASTRSHPPLKIFFDGGARPNPGRIEVAVVARGQAYFFDELGNGSNGNAEWLALLCALEVAQSLGVASFDLLGDSRSIIDQATGTTPCRTPAARAYLARFHALAVTAAPRRLRWLPRHQNLAGIALDQRRQHRSWPCPRKARDG